MIKEIHDQNFEQETNTGVTVVDFRADWCPPCKMMDPILKNLSESDDFKTKVTFTSLNVDHDQEVASRFRCSGDSHISNQKRWPSGRSLGRSSAQAVIRSCFTESFGRRLI